MAMVAYRRNFVAGGTYFFTVTLRDRRARFLVEHVGDLRRAFAQTRAGRPFVIEQVASMKSRFRRPTPFNYR
jgi:putative transposase